VHFAGTYLSCPGDKAVGPIALAATAEINAILGEKPARSSSNPAIRCGNATVIPPPPGLPFSLVFRAEPGKEDVILRIASAYEAASKRRIPPPAFGPLPPNVT
jgi:hypothetical protein